MDLFTQLISLPEKCIYAFFNHEDKKVYVGYSSNILRSLYSNFNGIKYSNMKDDINKLSFSVLEEVVDTDRLRIRYQFWSDHYSNIGYGLYRNYKAVGYKARIDVQEEPGKGKLANYKFIVKLISRGYRELIVGIFDDLSEANKFISLHYSNVNDIIYSDNELTNNYLRRNKL